jgi:hypothetical protein
MTSDERQALREKHRKDKGFKPTCHRCDLTKAEYEETVANHTLYNGPLGCGYSKDGFHDFSEWSWGCEFCGEGADEFIYYPCDVIKVLDATEPEVPINWAAGK